MTAVVEGPSTVAQPVAELLGAGVQPGSVVVAQTSTGPVAGWLVAEETQADAGERRCAVVGLEGESVVAAGPVSEVMVSGSPMPTNDVMPMWAPALAGAFWAARQARAQRDEARQALTAEQARWARIVQAASEFADAKGYCGDYDEFMEDHGLPGRTREFVAEVDAKVRVRVPVSGRNAEAAAGEVNGQAIADVLASMSNRDLFMVIDEFDVIDTEEA